MAVGSQVKTEGSALGLVEEYLYREGIISRDRRPLVTRCYIQEYKGRPVWGVETKHPPAGKYIVFQDTREVIDVYKF
jgi:hypothetical protein